MLWELREGGSIGTNSRHPGERVVRFAGAWVRCGIGALLCGETVPGRANAPLPVPTTRRGKGG